MNEELRSCALTAVVRAVRLCRRVQAQLVDDSTTMTKTDRSPVTVADFGAQAVICLTLRQAGIALPVVGEERADALREKAGRELRKTVVRHVSDIFPQVREDEVLDAIDSCSDSGGPSGQRWALDPIDGTKGYLRRGQYAIALALLEDGRPVFGVLGCPQMPVASGGTGCLFVAERGRGTEQLEIGSHTGLSVSADDVTNPSKATFCESVEADHSAHDRHARIAALLGVNNEPVRIDSQCKYAALARGDASIYLRLPTSATYQEKIWDHAAGWIVLTEAGGRVTDASGVELDFSLGRTLAHNRGVIATNGHLHQTVLDAVAATNLVTTTQ